MPFCCARWTFLYMERICFLKDYAGRVFNGSVLLTNWRKSRGARSVSNELLDSEFGWEIPEVSEANLASSKMKVVKFDENSAKKMWYVSSKNGYKKKFCFQRKTKWTHENVSHNPTTYHWTNFCFRSLRSLIGWGHLLFAMSRNFLSSALRESAMYCKFKAINKLLYI